MLQVNGETVKLGIPGAAQRMEASAKVMIPLQRVGTPEDAAGAMLLLACPYSSYISAQVLLSMQMSSWRHSQVTEACVLFILSYSFVYKVTLPQKLWVFCQRLLATPANLPHELLRRFPHS